MARSKIVDILSEHHQRFSPLQKLLRRAAHQQAWTAQLQALLPEPLCRDCRITEIRRGEPTTVVVVCKNAASATRLRFMIDDLLNELRKLSDFRGAEQILVRVSSA